jgi:hypothetical protein
LYFKLKRKEIDIIQIQKHNYRVNFRILTIMEGNTEMIREEMLKINDETTKGLKESRKREKELRK